MTSDEKKIIERAHSWFSRLLERDSIILDDDRSFIELGVQQHDEMDYTILVIDELGKLL